MNDTHHNEIYSIAKFICWLILLRQNPFNFQISIHARPSYCFENLTAQHNCSSRKNMHLTLAQLTYISVSTCCNERVHSVHCTLYGSTKSVVVYHWLTIWIFRKYIIPFIWQGLHVHKISSCCSQFNTLWCHRYKNNPDWNLCMFMRE